MACAQALSVPELLELILLHLPPKDLLMSQRVDRYWQETIRNSASLQKALFLLPGEADDTHTTCIKATLQRLSAGYLHDNKMNARLPEGGVAINPLLCNHQSYDVGSGTRPASRTVFWLAKTVLGPTGLHDLCRRMYLTQPPVDLKLWVNKALYDVAPGPDLPGGGLPASNGFDLPMLGPHRLEVWLEAVERQAGMKLAEIDSAGINHLAMHPDEDYVR